MNVAIRVLIASVLVWHSGLSLAKKLSIDDCSQTMTGEIDCRKKGFQNVPYDVFSIPHVKIYLGGNPFVCDCTMVWFLREKAADKKRIKDLRDMKCFAPGKGSMVPISKVKEKDICKTRPLRMKDYCKVIRGQWVNCQKSLKRVPYDIFKGRIKTNFHGRRLFSCDCDTVWFIRLLKPEYTPLRRRIIDFKKLLCMKRKGIAKPVPLYSVDEETVCPQREQDHCKLNPCPAKVTKCQKLKWYVTPPYHCIDVNECLKHPCPKHEVCVNKRKTGYSCECPKELERDKITMKCIPPDPCKDERNPCPSTSKCETIRSSSITTHRCVDLDECLTGKFDCGSGEECYNKMNGYSCQCKEGWIRIGASTCIVSTDPCKVNPPVCDLKTQRCVTKGKVIYFYECQDIDECSTKRHDCHKDAKCINTVPGYKCQCKPGFKEYNNGRQCKDLNECSDNSRCGKNAKCVNLLGSFKCKCNTGYFGDGKHCNDKDECSASGHLCSVDAECKNKPGTYECICNKGYYGNGKICKDLDECSQDRYSCPHHSKCKNTPGSYTCKCLRGFKLKEDRCLDVDECKSNSHTCDKNALCINFGGSYKCRCKEGYEHLKAGRLCLKEVETKDEDISMFVVLIAIPVCLLVIILFSLALYRERKNRKKRKTDNNEAELLLKKQFGQDTQAVFMFDPCANKEALKFT